MIDDLKLFDYWPYHNRPKIKWPNDLLYQNQKGYGNALIHGINNVKTEYLCIFNADGSFNPKYLSEMLELCKNRE